MGTVAHFPTSKVCHIPLEVLDDITAGLADDFTGYVADYNEKHQTALVVQFRDGRPLNCWPRFNARPYTYILVAAEANKRAMGLVV